VDQAEQYMNDVQARMTANGYEVTRMEIGGLPSLVGYKSEFRLRWMATQLHLYVFVAPISYVTPEWLEHYTRVALAYADRAKGATRGLQSGVAAIAALAGPGADPRALTYAQRELVRMFAGFAWPVIYNTTTKALTSHTGNPFVGWVYNGWIRQQIRDVLRADHGLVQGGPAA